MEQFQEKAKNSHLKMVWKDKSHCTGCAACAIKCSHKAITMLQDEEGFFYPCIDSDKCVDCGLCQKICPQTNTDKFLNTEEPQFYGGVISENELLMKSSSGGAFSAICNLLDKGSVVCGCTYDNGLKVIHQCAANTYEDTAKFRKSKYVQSDVRKVYKEIKEHLGYGKKVLFTGTACQVVGLYAYLGGKPDKLYTVDLICHGVPSQYVFDKYIDSLSRKSGIAVTRYSFREKSYFWGDWEIGIKYGNEQKSKYKAWGQDYYMSGFLRGLFYRPACYECKYANRNVWRPADFTIGDFWGCAEINPSFHEKKGCSLLIANSRKAKDLIPQLSKYMLLSEVNAETAIRENHNLIEPTKHNKQRSDFFRLLQEHDFETAIRILYKGKSRSHSQTLRVIITKLFPWLVMKRRKKIIDERNNR